MRRTTESFKKELTEINPNIEVLGEYVKVHLKVLYRCKICGNEWKAEPNSVLHGIGCPECGKIKCKESRKTGIEKLKIQLKEKNSEVEYYSGNYKNTDTKLFFKCLKCGNIWEATPHSILSAKSRSDSGNGCPKCKGRDCSMRKTKTHILFLEEFKNINSNIRVLSEYTKDKDYIDCECLKCGYLWKATPNHLLQNHGCPSCLSSIGELLIRRWLNEHNISFNELVKVKCKSIARSTNIVYIDFVVNILDNTYYIEYNGKQHYEYIPFLHKGDIINFEKQQRRDLEVKNYCKSNNITLIEIPYTINKYEDVGNYLKILINNDK